MVKSRGPPLKWNFSRLLGCTFRPTVLDEKPEEWSSHAGRKLRLSDSAKVSDKGLGPSKRDSEDGLIAYLGRSHLHPDSSRSVLSQAATSVATERALKAPGSDESVASAGPFPTSQTASPFAIKAAQALSSIPDDRVSWGTAHHGEEGPASSPASPATTQALSSVSLPPSLSFSSQTDKQDLNAARRGSGRSTSSYGGDFNPRNFSREGSFSVVPSTGSSGIADARRDELASRSSGRQAVGRPQLLPKALSGSLRVLPASRSVSRHLSLPMPSRSASLSHVSSTGSGSGILSRRHSAAVLQPAEDDNDGGSETSYKTEQLQRRLSEVFDQHHVPLEKLRRQMSNGQGSGEDLLQLMAGRVFLQQDVPSEDVSAELEDPSRSPESSEMTPCTVLTPHLRLPRIKTKVAKESMDSEVGN